MRRGIKYSYWVDRSLHYEVTFDVTKRGSNQGFLEELIKLGFWQL